MAEEPEEAAKIKSDPDAEDHGDPPHPLSRRERATIRIKSMKRTRTYSCFYACFAWLHSKLKTRVTWVVVMVFLGTADVMLNWLNFVDLVAEGQGHGLIIGPPPPDMMISLLVFTITGTLLYVPETLNTLSVFFHNGHTRVNLTHEMLVTICLEHIPLSAVNFFISRCQKSYGSLVQTGCGACSIIFYFIRLVWYAHMEGRALKANDKAKLNKGFFMLVCSLFAFGMAFPIMNWRQDPSVDMNDLESIRNISIFLMKAPMLEGRGHNKVVIDYLMEQEGRPRNHPFLLNSIVPIFQKEMEGHYAGYKCDTNASIIPGECLYGGVLCFKFIYAPPRLEGMGPYGQIWYNYAELTKEPDAKNYTCRPSEADLQGGWRLFYFTVKTIIHQQNQHNELYDPWTGTCSNPIPWYKTEIDPCENLNVDACLSGSS